MGDGGDRLQSFLQRYASSVGNLKGATSSSVARSNWISAAAAAAAALHSSIDVWSTSIQLLCTAQHSTRVAIENQTSQVRCNCHRHQKKKKKEKKKLALLLMKQQT